MQVRPPSVRTSAASSVGGGTLAEKTVFSLRNGPAGFGSNHDAGRTGGVGAAVQAVNEGWESK